jgi:hypothetical protein
MESGKVRALVDAGADPSAKNHEGVTIDVERVLADAGADPSTVENQEIDEECDQEYDEECGEKYDAYSNRS